MKKAARYATALAVALSATSCATQAEPQATPSPSTKPVSRPSPKSWACQAGKFHWGKVTHKDTLVAVSDAHQEDIPAGKTEKFTYHLAPIRTVTSAVTPDRKGDEVNAQAAVASLESATGLELAKAGTKFTLGPGERELSTSSGKSSGVMVAVVSIDTVEAPFSYGCSNDQEKSVRGTLATWQPGPYSSLFKCGIKEKLPRPEAEAEALMCGQVNSK